MLSLATDEHECRFTSKSGISFRMRPGIHVTIIDFAFSSLHTDKAKPIHSDVYLLAKKINEITSTHKPNKLIVDWREFANYILKKPFEFETVSEILDHPYFSVFGVSAAGGTRRRRKKTKTIKKK